MARIPLGALTTLNLSTHLDPMFVELYGGAGFASISTGAITYTGVLTGGTAAIAIGTNQIVKAADGKVAFGGAVSGTSLLKVYGDIEQDSTARKVFSNTLTVVSSSAVMTIDAGSANQLLFSRAGTESARITGTGALLIGRTAVSGGGKLEITGNIVVNLPSAAPTLGTNADMSFQLVSNTSLKILVRGSDGVTRSVSLTLA